MSFWNKINFRLISTPSLDKFQESLTAENTLEKLRAFNNDHNVLKAARYEGMPIDEYEWLLTSFQYAANKIAENHILDMANYMNNNEVFSRICPLFYGSTSTWTHLIQRLFDRCPPKSRPLLLSILERHGHMQGIIKAGQIGAGNGPFRFFRQIVEEYSVEDAKHLLRDSPSFQLVKKTKDFAYATIEYYPEYKDLL